MAVIISLAAPARNIYFHKQCTWLINIPEAQLSMNIFIFGPDIVKNSNLTVSGRVEGELFYSILFLNCWVTLKLHLASFQKQPELLPGAWEDEANEERLYKIPPILSQWRNSKTVNSREFSCAHFHPGMSLAPKEMMLCIWSCWIQLLLL